jgi:hypothetical protein
VESFNAVVTQHPFLRGEVYFINNIVINWPPGSVILKHDSRSGSTLFYKIFNGIPAKSFNTLIKFYEFLFDKIFFQLPKKCTGGIRK